MTLSSMTGFGQADGGTDGHSWRRELKSVNGRGLNIRCRLSSGFESLEADVRTHIGKSLSRGNVNVAMSLSLAGQADDVVVNEQALECVLDAMDRLALKRELAPPSAAAVLDLHDVLEISSSDEDPERHKTVSQKMLASLDSAVRDLAGARKGEEQKLLTILNQNVEAIADLSWWPRDAAGEQIALLQARVSEQVARVMGDAAALDEAGLHREVAVLATKADV